MEEFNDIDNAMQKYNEALNKAVKNPEWMEAFLNKYGQIVENEMKGFVPVRTGALQGSIKSIPVKTSIQIEMLYYGLFVDEGTRFMITQPFISQSFNVEDFAYKLVREMSFQIDKQL